MIHCPDCDRPQVSLIAAAAPPNVARRLCLICGYPLGYLGWAAWSAIGFYLDFKDDVYKHLSQEDEDDAIAA